MDADSLTESLRETLALFDVTGPPLTTTEVATALDLGRRSTYERLERLVEQGRLETKKVGASARVWWRPQATGTDEQSAPDWPAAAESLIDDVLNRAEVGVFVLDEDFEVAWINDATERYLGLDREQVLGRDKRHLVESTIASVIADSSEFADTVLATYDDNTDTERFECRVTPDGDRRERWLEHRSKPIEHGAYAGGRVELYYDVTDRKRSERAHRTEREKFESLVDAVEDYAIFTLDRDGYVQTWNAGAERIKGYDAAEIVGEHFSVFYTDEERAADVPTQNLAEARATGSVEDEGWRVRADGSRFWAKATITPIYDGEDLTGYAKVTQDMTERREYEQRLREEKAFTESILDNQRDIVYAFDADGQFRRWNDRLREVTGYRDEEIEAMGPVDFIADEAAEETRETVEQVLTDGESFTVELPLETAAGNAIPYEFSASAMTEDDGTIVGFTGVARDVSERKARERRLAQQREILEAELDEVFDRIEDGFFALDNELRFTYVNDYAADLLDISEAEVIGVDIWDVLEPGAVASRTFKDAVESHEKRSFEEYYEPLDAWFENHVYSSESGISVYFRDITERKERERNLEEYRRRYRTLVENFPNGAVALVDETLRYVSFGGTPMGDTDVSREDLEGEHLREALSEELADVVAPHYEAALEGKTATFEESVGGSHYRFHFAPVRDDDGEIFAAMGMSQDITERKEYERELEDAKSQLEAATEAGAIGTWEWHVPDDEMVTGPALATKFGVDPEAAREGVTLGSFVSAVHEEDRDRVEAEIETALDACGEYESEYRVWNADGERRWVVARGHVECDDDGTPVTFPGALTDITERKEAELELERQRQQLEAVNHLNEVVRDITSAVIDQSTRAEIERTVCERLAETESYLFAWIGDIDAASQTVNLRTEAGVDGYLDEITISADPADDRSAGPTGRAIRTREPQVTTDVETDARHDPWREAIEPYGFRSSASIPIVHEESFYGVLNVYAARPDAFQGSERDVIGQLGEVVGHAIAATERKQALMSDELVELDFQVQDVFSGVDHPTETSGRITLDHAVPVEDSEFLVYGTATPDAVETVRSLVETVPHWEAVTVHSEDDPVRFEVRTVDPPVLSVVASRGGYFDRAVIEDGDFRMTIHLTPNVDVRELIDVVEATYPGAEMLRRRQISRAPDDPNSAHRRLLADLTDRQRATLEAAYHAGFFEWPRDAAGEDVADSLGIASPTFHQHLRKAERKVFDALLSAPAPSTG
ncbi:PAS domain S-box protein [Halorientalis brevis]|uniref:PAS domain S-box protein n=1 Tax=Halorientalis brevis TaxID=1126241 RepID=A0ABD6CJI2_9EURY|nr:PAS domain S-box protein [Halorientalis brevis]